MQKSRWSKFILTYKEKYYSTIKVQCKALNGMDVHFNERGFNHLLMKSGHYRSKSDQKRRLCMFHLAPEIISNCKVADSRVIGDTKFWALRKITDNTTITVIIRKIGTEDAHFYSIMSKLSTNSTQTPKRGSLYYSPPT